ncbi:porin [Thiorhodococcus mannitoliphagus]|uniref:Porin n=1 Tax=Thiorhodococcus mannitoliphagus TaxID=329406 RepID=A0A6P1E0J4_9GAMM|nr:porin [Thiorhodococcus mannitoliphagus]NEX21972.1 porin [Thiorhodococcus mannitoliphagus]
MMNHRVARSVALLIAAGAFGAQNTALGAGFMLPEASVAGVGTSNALVANPEEVGAFAYNPAAMGFHEASSIAVGTVLINPNFSVETASGSHDSQGAEWVALPMIQAAIKLNDSWRLGFGITTPFGLETRWEDGTFPAVSGTRTLPVPAPLNPEVPLGHPTSSQLEVLDFSPTGTYRVNDNLSLSAGLDIYWTKTAKLGSTAGSLEGDGTGLGFNLGALYREGPWSFGASYRSSATVDVTGDYVPLSQTLVYLQRLEPAQQAEVNFDLPWRLQLGARYAVNEQLAVEVDVTRTGWSSFNDLKVTGKNTGVVIFADQNDWDDSNAYRLGVTYQVQPQTQLRFGYAYDETGQSDDHFSARVPDNDRHLFSIGLAQSLGQGYSLEAAYMYVTAADREYRSSTAYTGSDLNGTTALNGDYSFDAHLVGLQITKTF